MTEITVSLHYAEPDSLSLCEANYQGYRRVKCAIVDGYANAVFPEREDGDGIPDRLSHFGAWLDGILIATGTLDPVLTVYGKLTPRVSVKITDAAQRKIS